MPPPTPSAGLQGGGRGGAGSTPRGRPRPLEPPRLQSRGACACASSLRLGSALRSTRAPPHSDWRIRAPHGTLIGGHPGSGSGAPRSRPSAQHRPAAAQGRAGTATRPSDSAVTGRSRPGAGAAPVAPGSAVPLSTTWVGHVFQGPSEAGPAAGAREAAIRRLQVPALFFCPGRNDGVDHD